VGSAPPRGDRAAGAACARPLHARRRHQHALALRQLPARLLRRASGARAVLGAQRGHAHSPGRRQDLHDAVRHPQPRRPVRDERVQPAGPREPGRPHSDRSRGRPGLLPAGVGAGRRRRGPRRRCVPPASPSPCTRSRSAT
jgi:hypothetical protein